MRLTKQSVKKKLYLSEPEHFTCCRERAAVAFVISGLENPSLTLCVKAPHLRTHAGEVSLPGGKLELCDESAISGALRELFEETGLLLSCNQALGFLNPIQSLHEISVMPCVFWSDEALKGYPCEEEIIRVFSMPLVEFIEQQPTFDLSRNRASESWMPRWHFADQEIWGLTALIVKDFFLTVFNHRFSVRPLSTP
ncbi:MAG: CoA pyrophosphatase [Pseudomonadota bacterium]